MSMDYLGESIPLEAIFHQHHYWRGLSVPFAVAAFPFWLEIKDFVGLDNVWQYRKKVFLRNRIIFQSHQVFSNFILH